MEENTIAKTEFKITRPENKKVLIGGQVVEIRPYLLASEISALVSNYIEVMFDNPVVENQLGRDVIGAELNLLLGVIDLCTSIDAKTLDMDMLLSSDLIEEITAEISGYYDLRSKLGEAVRVREFELQIERSLGTVIDSVSSKLIDILEKFSEISPDEIKDVMQKSLTLLDEAKELPLNKELAKGKRKKVEKLQ